MMKMLNKEYLTLGQRGKQFTINKGNQSKRGEFKKNNERECGVEEDFG